MEREIPVRITVVGPPKGVTFRLQRGRAELVAPARALEDHLSFDFILRVIGDGATDAPNLRGAEAQGPPAERFVYVNSGTLAGQADSCCTRRAKVPLSGISWDLIEQVLSSPDAILEACIAGRANDGGPVCAKTSLLDGTWKVSPKSRSAQTADP